MNVYGDLVGLVKQSKQKSLIDFYINELLLCLNLYTLYVHNACLDMLGNLHGFLIGHF